MYLDVIGVLPEPSETAAFLADADPQKRAKLIDRLLVRPEFAEFWALKWGDLLRIRNVKVSNGGVHKFNRWLVAAFRDNMPYDQFARQLLTAEGSTFVNPPANYFRTATETNDCTETTSQLFLGIRIQCAKCHNHPFERWIAGQLLRHRRVLQPRAAEAGHQPRRAGDLGGPRGRSHAAAHRQADAALAAA